MSWFRSAVHAATVGLVASPTASGAVLSPQSSHDVLLAAAAFAALGAIVGFAYGRDPVRQAPPVAKATVT